MKISIAYIEEPPFYWTTPAGTVTGADIELAHAVLHAIGVTEVEHLLVSFDELLSGVDQGRWDMNVPIFITPERAQHVNFSAPVWTLGDGFLVRAGNPCALDSYAALAAQGDTRLGVIAGQVQIGSARAEGVSEGQLVVFKDQPEAIAGLLAGRVDAFAATALGNRVAAQSNPAVQAVALNASADSPVGGFSFSKTNENLRSAVDAQLRRYLGTSAHRESVARFGITSREIDPVLGRS